jgi:hypothetical protein
LGKFAQLFCLQRRHVGHTISVRGGWPTVSGRLSTRYWVELRGSGQDGKTVRECVSKRETKHLLAGSPVHTEQTSEASGEEKPSETGRKWVAPPPAVLAVSCRRTRLQRPSSPCLVYSGCCRRWLRSCIRQCNGVSVEEPCCHGHRDAWAAVAGSSSCRRSVPSRNRIAPMSQGPIRRCSS